MTTETAKPLLRALSGETVWPPPIWLMRQAGRYLPEYRAIRARAGDFIALCTSPELAAEVTLQPIRRYGFDAAILFSDILMLPRALGHGLTFREGDGPVLPPIKDAHAIGALEPARLLPAITPILETVQRVRAGLLAEGHERTALIGFAGAPFTVACYMVEGGGSKDFAATRGMAYGRPELFARLMDTLTEATVIYLAAQVEAGAETVMLFDSWAGILSPRMFCAHVIEPTAKIARRLKARFTGLRLIGFPRLAGTMLGTYARDGECDAVGLDTATDPETAIRLLPRTVTVQGNLDPMALDAGGPVLANETRSILGAMRGRQFVFNLGHGILPSTPVENVAELVRLVRAG